MRIGHGYDVHKLVPGRAFILGGVDIPFEKGLLGHSDADVLVHAVIDALLGAAALGDIGAVFPDSSDEFKDADSIALLRRTGALLRLNGFDIVNIDATVLAERPKLRPFICEMRRNIASALETEIDKISVKATSEEGLGFTGEGCGVAAHAITLIEQSATLRKRKNI